MTLRERALSWQRCGEAYDAHRQGARAHGRCLSYRLEDLYALVARHLDRPVCPYCHGPFTAATLALGHKVPIARGGRFLFKNLDVCCQGCHLLKGVLDHQEFRELLQLIHTWPRPVGNNFLARLRAGTPVTGSVLPPVGSLEWFTGSTEPHAPRTPRAPASGTR
jgi:hypothetical protein